MDTMESIIRERADVLAHEARQYPRTAHMAHMWMLAAQRWADLHGSKALKTHLDLRISSLARHRRERLCRCGAQPFVWIPMPGTA